MDAKTSGKSLVKIVLVCVGVGVLLGLSEPVILVKGQNLGGDQEVVGGVTQVPRNPRKTI